MPNDTKPCKSKATIDAKANQALADVDKVLKAHPNLELELKPVKDNLKAIAMDNHHYA